jgi:hypothetical protein
MTFLLEDIGDRFDELQDATNEYATSQVIKFIPFAQTFDLVLDKPYRY